MKVLIEGKKDISSLPKNVCTKIRDIFECLTEIPLLDILKLIDTEKAKKIFNTIDKIVALAHVSQSMGNYFARDDALDPALSTVCTGLGGESDFGHILRVRGGTFQSLASRFNHLKSPGDRDLSGSTRATRGRGFGGENSRTSQRQPRAGNYCWDFQRGQCSRRQNCRFQHRCMTCGNRNHGSNYCNRS